MAPETREWSVPTPIRALLWWPALSFALVVIDPDAATGVIIGAGLVLALLGAAVPVVARALRPRATAVEPSTVEFPVQAAPAVADERAA